jgi:hypothetical protein
MSANLLPRICINSRPWLHAFHLVLHFASARVMGTWAGRITARSSSEHVLQLYDPNHIHIGCTLLLGPFCPVIPFAFLLLSGLSDGLCLRCFLRFPLLRKHSSADLQSCCCFHQVIIMDQRDNHKCPKCKEHWVHHSSRSIDTVLAYGKLDRAFGLTLVNLLRSTMLS